MHLLGVTARGWQWGSMGGMENFRPGLCGTAGDGLSWDPQRNVGRASRWGSTNVTLKAVGPAATWGVMFIEGLNNPAEKTRWYESFNVNSIAGYFFIPLFSRWGRMQFSPIQCANSTCVWLPPGAAWHVIPVILLSSHWKAVRFRAPAWAVLHTLPNVVTVIVI